VIDTWIGQKNTFKHLQDAELKIIQGSQNEAANELKYVNELYESKKAELLNKDERIRLLEEELASLSELKEREIPFNAISAEAKANYTNLAALGFSYTVITDFSKTDTIPVFQVGWKEGTQRRQITADTKKLNDWLKIRIKNPKVQVRQQ